MSAKTIQSGFLVLLLTAYISKASCTFWDSGCGVTKGCFPDSPDDYLVTWQDKGSSISFTMKAQKPASDSYLAIAFSDDYRMGDDSVVTCITFTTTDNVQSSYNEGTDNDALSPATFGITSGSVKENGTFMECSFDRQTSGSDSRFFDLNSDYYIQLVTGKAKAKKGETKLDKHDEIPWFSASKVDFQSNATWAAYKLNSPLVKTHGIMMVLGWLLFSLVGVMTARYNKDMLPNTKLFGTKVWFQLHRGLMVAVAVCAVVGFITIFVEIKGYSQVTPGESGATQAHPVLGIIITCLVLINPIGALFRPGPDHKFRWLFNWGHLGLGVIAQFLAVLTIFFGYFADRSKVPTSAAYVTGAHVAVVIFFFVFFEVRKRIQPAKQDAANGKIGNSDMTSEELVKKKKSVLTDPTITLVVFSVVSFGFALAVLVIIAAS